MSELATYVALGFRHITDLAAVDHILFLLALAAIYRLRDWRDALWVVSAFTVGHSVTLALAVSGALVLPTRLIEFLIPVTNVATCVENLVVRDRRRTVWGGHDRPVFAGVFGLVHGAGFANYLRSLFVDQIALPLFGFNVGIELGQLTVVTATLLLLTGLDYTLRSGRVAAGSWPRGALASVAAATCAAVMAVQRLPW